MYHILSTLDGEGFLIYNFHLKTETLMTTAMTLDTQLQITETLLPKTTYAEFKTLFTLSTRCNLPMHHLALMTDVGIYSQLCPWLCSLRKYNLKLKRQVSGYTKQTQNLR
jgi:hypothetical protein